MSLIGILDGMTKSFYKESPYRPPDLESEIRQKIDRDFQEQAEHLQSKKHICTIR